ncbi:MAG: helix-turn-helix transcriptional regulator [Burkholderiales bacterium]|nr:helix-turn-helix transcriptional regulator [Burkholderiales bacterium]
MKDFAAAAMLRLISQGLARLGIAPTGRAPRAALVPLADKRHLVEALLAAHGAVSLLRLGEAVNDLGDDPTLMALTLAVDLHDLVRRWQRLERFVHSRHRVQVAWSAPARLVLAHVSLDRDPPGAAEDLLVFGLLVALASRQVAPGLRARFAGERRWRYGAAGWVDRPLPRAVSTWELAWDPMPSPLLPMPPAASADKWIAWVRERLAADPGRSWTVRALAAEAGLPARTLQRRFAAVQTSFRSLVAQARLAAAARLLTTSAAAPAEVAYVCGYADQAHFTREFKRHTALTPARYRAEFAAPALAR